MSSYRRTATAAIRLLSRPFLLLLTGVVAPLSHAAPPPDNPTPRRQTLRVFFDDLGSDRVLRARFARSPRDALGERGLDLPGLALPDRLTEAEIDRLLKQWPIVCSISPSTRGVGPQAEGLFEKRDAVAAQPNPGPPVPVYGPPPGPRRRDDGARAPPRVPDPAPDQPDDNVPPASTPPADRN